MEKSGKFVKKSDYLKKNRIFFDFSGENFRIKILELTELCEKLKTDRIKQYCSTLNFHSSLREMYNMVRQYRGDFLASQIR
jgi:hypothetical protein